MSDGSAVIRLISRTEEEAIASLPMKTRAFVISITMKNMKVSGRTVKNAVLILGKMRLGLWLQIE